MIIYNLWEKLKMRGVRVGLVVGLAAILSGCAMTRDEEGALFWNLLGAHGAQKGHAGAAALGSSMGDFYSSKAGRSQVNVNVHGGEVSRYTRIMNLKTGEKEVDLVGSWVDYLSKRKKEGLFPREGYLVIEVENGEVVWDGILIERNGRIGLEKYMKDEKE